MSNFWQQLNKPIFCLAPMEEVTDVAFREMFAKYGKPDVMYTEFVNIDGLTHPEGRKKLELDLKYTEAQRPMVAQIWGRSPLKFEEAAKIVVDLGFDGIDINMGCPQDKEIDLGTCAALIKEPELAVEIIKFTKRGAGNLPVSVKTRIGYNAEDLDTWLKYLLSAEPVAIAVHGRTRKDKSKVPADWQAIAKAVQIRNAEKFSTIIIGNGDVKSRQEALEKIKLTGVDGVMIGRGAFGNPWIFREDNYEPTIKERLSVMLEHARLFNETLGAHKPFVIMRKHFKAYVSGFDGAAVLRAKLMETKSLEQTEEIVKTYFAENSKEV
jgi:nifR3 family TIM-barrel protein